MNPRPSDPEFKMLTARPHTPPLYTLVTEKPLLQLVLMLFFEDKKLFNFKVDLS